MRILLCGAPPRRAHALAPLIVAIAVLAGPGAAAAHPRAAAVALDTRLRLFATAIPGVEATVIDGDRELRLDVRASMRLVVPGLLGEPFLRFDRQGVWLNASSPTAAADRLVSTADRAAGWRHVARGHVFTWHDHRLAPPPLAAGRTASWSLPVLVDGRRARLAGEFVRAPKPQLWPWLAGAGVAASALWAAGRRRRSLRLPLATASAAVAALAALAASAGFATGDQITRLGRWLDLAAAAVLALAALGVLRIGDLSTRAWVATIVGVIAAAFVLGSLGVFRHGFVISSLPATLARLAVCTALVCGIAAAVLGIAAAETPTRQAGRS